MGNDIMQRIVELISSIESYKKQIKPGFLIEDDTEYQEQLELRWHIQELEDELDKLLEQNRAEEEIEGWG